MLDLTALNEFIGRLRDCRDRQTALEAILDTSIALHSADFGNIQMYDAQRGDLEIVAQRGFRESFLAFFQRVSVEDGSACGRAMREGRPIVVEDVEADAEYAPYRAVAGDAGYRAVQSTPLVTSSGRFVGMLSTHFAYPRMLGKVELVLTTLYARHAADIVAKFEPSPLAGV
jgi:GAF domain-containing protein